MIEAGAAHVSCGTCGWKSAVLGVRPLKIDLGMSCRSTSWTGIATLLLTLRLLVSARALLSLRLVPPWLPLPRSLATESQHGKLDYDLRT
jgi:hypothetical protein